MKRTTRHLFITMFMLIVAHSHAQQVAINEDASAPNPNAILDVKSFTKGVLIPRMSSAQRITIPNTRGLLVYDSTTNSFWYNTGVAWQNLAPGGTTGNAWGLNGNSGNTTANFLGTTDAQALRIKVNNEPAGFISVSLPQNTFFGYTAGASIISGGSNTGVGHASLSANSSGNWNSAFGRQSLWQNTTGSNNTATGTFALAFNTTGNENTATGEHALFANVAAHYNTAMGFQAMMFNQYGSGNTAIGYTTLKNSSGDYNTAIGSSALFTNSTGQRNTAGGNNAMYSNRDGQSNTALGNHALYFNTGGWLNTAVGNQALYSNLVGHYNTAIGFGADVNGGSMSNTTAIGFGAIVNLPNKIRIGNSAVFVIEGGGPFSTPSDGRFKNNIREDVKGLDFILQLRPVTYQFNAKQFDEQQRVGMKDVDAPWAMEGMESAYQEASAIRRSGFIAQEVEEAAASSGYDFSGLIKPKSSEGHYSVSYESFVVPLVKAVQELSKRVEQLEKENASLKKAGLK